MNEYRNELKKIISFEKQSKKEIVGKVSSLIKEKIDLGSALNKKLKKDKETFEMNIFKEKEKFYKSLEKIKEKEKLKNTINFS